MTPKSKVAAAAIALAAIALLAWQITKRRSVSEESPPTADSAKPRGQTKGANLAAAAPSAISGIVRDESGAPVAAIVQLSPLDRGADPPAVATATADGAFAFEGLAAGSFRVSASQKSYLPALSKEIELAAGATERVELTLVKGGSEVSGLISDISGGPIAAAFVRLTPIAGILEARRDRSFSAITSSDGRFETSAKDGAYLLSAEHPDYVSRSVRVEISGGNRELRLSLIPGAVIEGTALLAGSREPAAGAVVSFQRETVTRGFVGGMRDVRDRGRVRADANGKFRITGAGAGIVLLSARTDAAATSEETIVPIGIAETVTGVELFLDAGFRISGRVVDGAGDAVASAKVEVDADGRDAVAGLAQADGTFSLGPFAPGRYLASAGARGPLGRDKSVAVEIVDKDVEGVVVLADGGALMIRGRVEPAVDADISMAFDKPGSGMIFGSQATDDQGRFEIGPVSPGETVPLRAVSADGRLGEVEVKVGADGADGVVIALKEAASVSGRVIDQDGKPMSGATVALRAKRSGGQRMVLINGAEVSARRAVSGAGGAFTVAALEAGDYAVTVKDDSGQSLHWARPETKALASEPLEMTVGKNEKKTGVTLAVVLPSGEIRGRVLGPDGKPAADVFVTASPSFEFNVQPPPPESQTADGGPRPEGAEPDQERAEMVMMVGTSDDEGGEGHGALAGASFAETPPVITDEDGRFVISGLRSGKYEVTAEGLRGTARGFATGVETDADITIKLLPLTVLEGTVTRDGKPVESFSIELAGPTLFSRSYRDKSGAFKVRRLDPGTYKLTAKGDGGEAGVEVEVVAGKPTVVEIALKGQLTIRGVLVDDAGAPIPSALVILTPRQADGEVQITMDSSDAPNQTSETGAFELRSLPGAFTLIALKPGAGPLLVKPIDVSADLDLGTLTAEGPPE